MEAPPPVREKDDSEAKPPVRASARIAALPAQPAKPSTYRRRIQYPLLTTPTRQFIQPRSLVGFSTSYLHPQLANLLAVAALSVSPGIDDWRDAKADGSQPLLPRGGQSVIRLLATVSTPLSVAAKWLRDVIAAIAAGGAPGPTIDGAIPVLEAAIGQ